MGISTARRVREGLAELIRFVNDPATPTSDLKIVLAECKGYGGQLAVLQADTAAGVAARERHGDGGVGVLVRSAGLSKRDAASQVKTVEKLQEMPAARDALESGEISVANAKTLAATSDKTSARQVEQDSELLAKAADLTPEQFAQEAGRWVAKRQADDGEELYRRQRARRRLAFWDGDDGMVHLRGELDPVTGAKVRKRFAREAERLRRADLHSPGGEKRNLNQRMADALETLTSHGSIYSRAAEARDTARTGAVHMSEVRTGEVRTGQTRMGEARFVAARFVPARPVPARFVSARPVPRPGAARQEPAAIRVRPVSGSEGANSADRCRCGGRPSADITIVQHLSADGTEAFAEVAGGGVIPQSVLEEHFCNAQIKGVVFSGEGVPLWHGHAKRRATKAQMNALRARYGACGGCGADMWICDGHHIRPVSEGGPTNIDNLMLACWVCHQKIHHHGWRVVPDGRGLHTIAPPERIRHGPAHAPDPPPAHGPPDRYPPRAARPSSEKATRRSPATRSGPDGSSADHAEPLFTVA